MPKGKGKAAGMAERTSRLAAVSAEPKFVRLPEKAVKVAVDARFAAMFDDPRFSEKVGRDKRGRPTAASAATNLRRFYRQASDEEEAPEPPKPKRAKKKLPKAGLKKLSPAEESSDEEGESGGDVKPTKKLIKKPKKNAQTSKSKKAGQAKEEKLVSDDESDGKSLEDKEEEKEESGSGSESEEGGVRMDLARGTGNVSSSTSDSSESEGDWAVGSESSGEEAPWGELDADAPTSEDPPTHRLAVLNLNWDRLRAKDLYVLFNSFKPQGAALRSVRVFPSEFGKARMAEEAVRGPAELVATRLTEEVGEGEGEEDEEIQKKRREKEVREQREKIRAYQLQRLKYFYAIVECDSAATAAHLYEECNGAEYESSAEKLDLRFVPDDMAFEEAARDECAELPALDAFEPSLYADSALQQSTAKLTWDEDDPFRAKRLAKAFKAKDERQLDELTADLVASGSSDDEEAAQRGRAALLDVLQGPDDHRKPLFSKGPRRAQDEEEEGMEMSWKDGDEAEEGGEELDEEEPKPSKAKTKAEKAQRPWDSYLERRKEKKRAFKAAVKAKRDEQKALLQGPDEEERPAKKRKADKAQAKPAETEADPSLALLVSSSASERGKNYSLKKLLAGEGKASDDFEADLADPRFAKLHASHHFNVDPSDPAFKATPTMEALLSRKLKPKAQGSKETGVEKAPPKAKAPEWTSTATKLKAKAAEMERRKRAK